MYINPPRSRKTEPTTTPAATLSTEPTRPKRCKGADQQQTENTAPDTLNNRNSMVSVCVFSGPVELYYSALSIC